MLQIAFGPQTSFLLHGSGTTIDIDFRKFLIFLPIFLFDTLTLVVDARLRRRAILVASTSQNARSVDASLLRLALRVRDTRNHALVARALFAR